MSGKDRPAGCRRHVGVCSGGQLRYVCVCVCVLGVHLVVATLRLKSSAAELSLVRGVRARLHQDDSGPPSRPSGGIGSGDKCRAVPAWRRLSRVLCSAGPGRCRRSGERAGRLDVAAEDAEALAQMTPQRCLHRPVVVSSRR